ncbi:MAG TPA: HPr family phosphocarrier protein [Opitutaceae bacterium]|nr:HPr family phosphocarrier protein [Opitutaceae bacterium]
MDSSRHGTIIAIFICDTAGNLSWEFLGCKPRLPTKPSPANFLLMEKSDTTPALQPLVKELLVQNKMGVHARPAAMIVRITNRYKCDVFVEKEEEQVNGKSIMGLMMLAAGKDSKVKFIATGDDAVPMLAELETLFARKFDEA